MSSKNILWIFFSTFHFEEYWHGIYNNRGDILCNSDVYKTKIPHNITMNCKRTKLLHHIIQYALENQLNRIKHVNTHRIAARKRCSAMKRARNYRNWTNWIGLHFRIMQRWMNDTKIEGESERSDIQSEKRITHNFQSIYGWLNTRRYNRFSSLIRIEIYELPEDT